MPAIRAHYAPPTRDNAEARKLTELGDAERKTRKRDIDRFWAYYEGNHKRPLKVKAGESDPNVIVNLCGQAIDKLVAMFTSEAPKIQLPGETPQPDDESPAQQALDTFWEDNQLVDFMVNWALSGFISGQPVIKLLEAERPGELPRAVILDPRIVTVYWDIADTSRALWYRLQWELDTNDYRRQDIVPEWLLTEGDETPEYDPDGAWRIIEYEQSQARTGGRWVEVGSDTWNYPFPPVLDTKNGPAPHDYYGPSDLKYYELNDAVNFVASNTNKIIKYHASPKTVLFGASLESPDGSADSFWEIPDADGKAHLDIVELRGDLSSSMKMYDLLRGAFFTQMRVVDWAAQKDKVGQLTNFGLHVLYGDMENAIEGKWRLYGRALAEVSRRALWLMGHKVDAAPIVDASVKLPEDRRELVESVKGEKDLGITSDRTLAAELGRDYDREIERKSEEGSMNTENQTDRFAAIMRSGGFGAFNSIPGMKTGVLLS